MFHPSKEELVKATNWIENHECHFRGKFQGAIGGLTTYHFTNTSLGTVFKLSCACGAQVDVTDYEDW
jgi:translation initiation factor 1 (eIF-1/SUI1)